MNLKYYFKNLMKDRNGVDGLFYLFFVLYLLLSGFNFMYHSVLIYRINLLLLVLAVFRLISKNKVQRKKENDVFIRFLSFFLPKSSVMKRKIMDPFKAETNPFLLSVNGSLRDVSTHLGHGRHGASITLNGKEIFAVDRKSVV